jgi:hypothetical protein
MYDERESNVFAPGELFLLYIEPIGFAYGDVTDEEGNQLYAMNFTVDSFELLLNSWTSFLLPAIKTIISSFLEYLCYVSFTLLAYSVG